MPLPNGAAPPANGSDIASQLMELVQPILASPKGQMMAQAILGQMGGGGGGDPRARMAQMPMGKPTGQDAGNPMVDMRGSSTMGRGPATDGELTDMVGAAEGARPDLPPQPRDGYTGGPTDEEELAEVANKMGGGNGGPTPNTGGVNQGGPTAQEVQMLKSSPTERNVRNFMKLFGPEITNQILGGGQGGGAPQGGPSYEDDVKASMGQPHGAGESDYNDNQGHDD